MAETIDLHNSFVPTISVRGSLEGFGQLGAAKYIANRNYLRGIYLKNR
jgi:hypothetical protein